MHKLALVGAGGRGRNMMGAAVATPGRARVVAVADQKEEALTLSREQFGLPEDACFRDYESLLAKADGTDGVFIATLPDSHAEIACAFLKAGIPIFLEKPMALDLDGAIRITRTARQTGTRMQLGFNMRYQPLFEKLKEVVSSGGIGQLISVEWKEVIRPHHWSTYCKYPNYNMRSVIGNWLLEKSCHDIDLLGWVVDSPCVRVCSFANRSVFVPRPDLPHRCTDGCPIEKECAFSALKFYPVLRESENQVPDYKKLCVYNAGSDHFDHQSTVLEYENGVPACFSLMPAGSHDSRYIHICGTKATVKASCMSEKVEVISHDSSQSTVFDMSAAATSGGHGGADNRTIRAFLDFLDDPENTPRTTVEEGWQAMVTCCAADQSAREHRTVELDELRRLL